MEKNEPSKNNKRPNEEGQGGKAPKAPRLNEEGKILYKTEDRYYFRNPHPEEPSLARGRPS